MSHVKPRVLMLGGGFGGIGFERALARGVDVDATLVNRDNFFSLLRCCRKWRRATSISSNRVSPIRKLLRHVAFFHGTIESIDLTRKRVGLSHAHETHYTNSAISHTSLTLLHLRGWSVYGSEESSSKEARKEGGQEEVVASSLFLFLNFPQTHITSHIRSALKDSL